MFRTACLALVLSALHPAPPPLVVSAAISLTDALRDIERAYTAAGGGPVRFNLAGSNVLARQVVNGAPADIFISADETQMNFAQARRAIDESTRFDLLTNRLAVVTPRRTGTAIADVQALLRARRIAVADPAAVPAGVYARQFLERSGVWPAVQDRLIPLANVRAALSAAESGGVDAAIVYESDAATSQAIDVGFIVTGAAAPRIVYPAAILKRTKNREAAVKFLAFLRGPEAGAIFRRYSFSVPPVRPGGRGGP
ncbi:MAG TPA: molybdate ABC transporter substrate-binding protein [Vicinamibacterales bacterium]|nr:molybdate ABC transporter substrate-binding protein [Vicinamibacterales bacterium]